MSGLDRLRSQDLALISRIAFGSHGNIPQASLLVSSFLSAASSSVLNNCPNRLLLRSSTAFLRFPLYMVCKSIPLCGGHMLPHSPHQRILTTIHLSEPLSTCHFSTAIFFGPCAFLVSLLAPVILPYLELPLYGMNLPFFPALLDDSFQDVLLKEPST